MENIDLNKINNTKISDAVKNSQLQGKDLENFINENLRNNGKNYTAKVTEITNSDGTVKSEVKVLGMDGMVADVNTPIANEFYASLPNLLLSVKYADGVDLSGVLGKLAVFEDEKEWLNGQIEIVGQDLKEPNTYIKNPSFNQLFNPADRTIANVFGADTYKYQTSILVDNTVIGRAFAGGDGQNFIDKTVAKNSQDLLNQFQKDMRDYIDSSLALFATMGVDSSTETFLKDYLSTQRDAISAFEIPSVSYNETGFVAATPPESVIAITNNTLQNRIDVYEKASAYHNEYVTFPYTQITLPMLDGVLGAVLDREKIAYKATINQAGSRAQEAWSTIFENRLWFGFYNVPWLNGITIIDSAASSGNNKNLTKQEKLDLVYKADKRFREKTLAKVKSKIKELNGSLKNANMSDSSRIKTLIKAFNDIKLRIEFILSQKDGAFVIDKL